VEPLFGIAGDLHSMPLTWTPTNSLLLPAHNIHRQTPTVFSAVIFLVALRLVLSLTLFFAAAIVAGDKSADPLV
jgi:hypothetical protein